MRRSLAALLLLVLTWGCQDASSPLPSEPPRLVAEQSDPIPPTSTQQFIEAAFRGDINTVKARLKDGVDVDARYESSPSAFKGADGGTPVAGANWTALHAAASALRREVIELLIGAGASLDLDDGYGATALAMSVDVYDREQQMDDCALLLIKAGAKVNTKTGIYIDGVGGDTPLHRAVCWNQKRAVVGLIEAGADVNAKDDGGTTPLHDAYLCDVDAVIVDALLAAGADPNAKDNDGRTPSHCKSHINIKALTSRLRTESAE